MYNLSCRPTSLSVNSSGCKLLLGGTVAAANNKVIETNLDDEDEDEDVKEKRARLCEVGGLEPEVLLLTVPGKLLLRDKRKADLTSCRDLSFAAGARIKEKIRQVS